MCVRVCVCVCVCVCGGGGLLDAVCFHGFSRSKCVCAIWVDPVPGGLTVLLL